MSFSFNTVGSPLFNSTSSTRSDFAKGLEQKQKASKERLKSMQDKIAGQQKAREEQVQKRLNESKTKFKAGTNTYKPRSTSKTESVKSQTIAPQTHQEQLKQAQIQNLMQFEAQKKQIEKETEEKLKQINQENAQIMQDFNSLLQEREIKSEEQKKIVEKKVEEASICYEKLSEASNLMRQIINNINLKDPHSKEQIEALKAAKQIEDIDERIATLKALQK